VRNRILIVALVVSFLASGLIMGSAGDRLAVAHAAPRPDARAVAVRMVSPAAAQSAPDQAVPESAAMSEASDDLPPPVLAGWPGRGTIRYKVLLGDHGLQVGEALHEWSHDGKRYRMSAHVETTGLIGMLRKLRYVQRSEGGVGPDGLVPERFTVEQSGKKSEAAEFDWRSGEVTIRRGSRVRVAAIRRGDQDLLSLWHQIGIVGAAGLPRELGVVSGKAATPSVLERVGEETASLPIGQLPVLHLRARALDGKLSIDIWLARDYGMLPVRIRAVDDKGEILDQQAVELRLPPALPGAGEKAASGSDAAGAPDPIVQLRGGEDPFKPDVYEN
jgi:hypothetical protein